MTIFHLGPWEDCTNSLYSASNPVLMLTAVCARSGVIVGRPVVATLALKVEQFAVVLQFICFDAVLEVPWQKQALDCSLGSGCRENG